MCGPPDPQMERAALAGSPEFQSSIRTHQNTQAAQDRQALILRERFSVGFALAHTLAPLIWGLPR
jgi:hypothetical protein